MCQAKVILQQGEESELLMEDVIHLRVDGNKVWLSTFFEPPTSVHAYIKEADFLKHTVTLMSLDDEGSN